MGCDIGVRVFPDRTASHVEWLHGRQSGARAHHMRNAEVIRQWQILREIEAHRTGVTSHDLAKKAGVTTRTIRRDLQAPPEAGFAMVADGGGHATKRWK